MTPLFRVRYALLSGRRPGPGDVRSLDHPGPLFELPRALPAGAYVLSVENLAEGRAIHWTRWPDAIRPGVKDQVSGRVRT